MSATVIIVWGFSSDEEGNIKNRHIVEVFNSFTAECSQNRRQRVMEVYYV